ncbi:MAG: hypothetical protein V8Q42_11160 [Anaerovoracaceae bacterium]
MIEAKIKGCEVHSVLDNEIIIKLADRKDLGLVDGKNFDGYTLILKKKKPKSVNINSYMWQLCDKIARKIRATKDDVYRKAVREVGVYIDTIIPGGREAEFESMWAHNGTGWFAEEVGKWKGNTVYRAYSGSSVYDMEQMRRLVDWVVDEATYLKIETMTPLEIEHLQSMWKGESM